MLRRRGRRGVFALCEGEVEFAAGKNVGLPLLGPNTFDSQLTQWEGGLGSPSEDCTRVGKKIEMKDSLASEEMSRLSVQP